MTNDEAMTNDECRKRDIRHSTFDIRQFPSWRFWAWPAELKRAGIVGINRRNGRYVLPLNPRPSTPAWTKNTSPRPSARRPAFPCRKLTL